MEDNVPGFIGYHITREEGHLKLPKIPTGKILRFLIEN